MHGLVSICLVTLALFVHEYQCIPAGEQPIKLMLIENHYWNPKYMSALDYFVTPHNRTYNNLGIHWVVTKDLPVDTSLLVHVYITDSKYQNAKLLWTDDTPICKESKYRELLPKIGVVDESLLGTKCLKKGTYDMQDMGQPRFEVLFPNLDKEGLYYIVHHKLHSGDETFLYSTNYNQWGLL